MTSQRTSLASSRITDFLDLTSYHSDLPRHLVSFQKWCTDYLINYTELHTVAIFSSRALQAFWWFSQSRPVTVCTIRTSVFSAKLGPVRAIEPVGARVICVVRNWTIFTIAVVSFDTFFAFGLLRQICPSSRLTQSFSCRARYTVVPRSTRVTWWIFLALTSRTVKSRIT